MSYSKWKEEAMHLQDEWQKMMGEIQTFSRNDMSTLKRNIGYAMFGHPHSLPSYDNYYTGYNKKHLQCIGNITFKIIDLSKRDDVLISFVLLVIKMEVNSPDASKDIVIRIHEDGNNSDSIFIDRHSRIYNSWIDFEKTNLLPICIYCYPESGHYLQPWRPGYLRYSKSPACSTINVAVDKLDRVACVTSFATAGVIGAGAFITLAPPIAAATTAGIVASGIYSAVRSIARLVDRKTHGQSISVADNEARQSWLNIGTSVLGGAGGACVSRAQHIVSSGREISKASVRTMYALNTANVAVSSISALDSLVHCVKKHNEQAITPQDLFNLSCDILFFFNAVSSMKATNKLLSIVESTNVTPNGKLPKLTKSSRRRLNKRRAIRNQKLQSALHKHKEKYLTTISQRILFEAVNAFAPNIEDVVNTVCCIGHDLKCLKVGTISFTNFLNNSYSNVRHLYQLFMTEFDSAFSEIKHLFISKDTCVKKVQQYYKNASDSAKIYFNCVLYWIKFKFYNLMKYLGIVCADLYDDRNENNPEADEVPDSSDDEEPHEKVLLHYNDLIEDSDIKFSCLEDYVNILNFLCLNIMKDLKNKVLDYKKNCKIFESMDQKNGVDIYKKSLGIVGDPQDYFLKESIRNHINESDMTKIKPMSLLKKNMCKNFDHMLNLEEKSNLLYYVNKNGSGDISAKENIFHAIYETTNKYIDLKNVEITQGSDVIILVPKEKITSEMWFRGIFMHYSKTEDNEFVYLITVI